MSLKQFFDLIGGYPVVERAKFTSAISIEKHFLSLTNYTPLMSDYGKI